MTAITRMSNANDCGSAAEHARQLRAQGVSLPHPQTHEDVRHHSNGWAAERGIEWSRVVLSVVKLPLEE